jgi:hypothetical protein
MEHRNQEKLLIAHGVDQLDWKGPEHHPAKPEGRGRLLHHGEGFWILQREGDTFVEFLISREPSPSSRLS